MLPFEVSDAARSEEEIKEAEAAGELKARVSQDVRLNGRYIDLRTAANQAIFKVQSGVCQVSCELYRKHTCSEIMLASMQLFVALVENRPNSSNDGNVSQQQSEMSDGMTCVGIYKTFL